MKRKILIVEDSLTLSRAYQGYLAHSGYDTVVESTGQAAFENLMNIAPDLILLDLGLPDADGLDILERLRSGFQNIPVVIITSTASLQIVVRAMRAGALDYLVKPFNQTRLIATVESSLEHSTLRKTVSNAAASSSFSRPRGLIGEAPVMQAIYGTIDAVASSDASVFITGETGTGKELVAQALHERSKRSHLSFHAINCGAIPTELMESELFGHVKGAFSGATADRAGVAEVADGGTLFFDELVELPMALQAKLLRFVQLGTYCKVGETKSRTANIRFLCAMNKSPLGAVAEGTLREDLYYRLNVIPIELPPLRERGDDVLKIAEAFLKLFSEEEGKGFKSLSEDVHDVLRSYDWPGNVRQLQNVIRNAVVLHDAEELTMPMLPRSLMKAGGAAFQTPFINRTMPNSEILPLALVERNVIEQAVKAASGNIQKAARLLEIDPSTIHRRRRNWKAVA